VPAASFRDALRSASWGRGPKADSALRHIVLSFQDCLGSVPQSERRVLRLRAGVGIARTRTRAEVAHLTGMRRARVARLERRGLKRLRALSGAGTCMSAGSAAPAGVPVQANAGTTQPSSASNVLSAIGTRQSPQSGESKTSAAENAIEAAIERPIIQGLGRNLDLGPLMVAFALGGLLFVVVRELRRA
jgi:hypothetical protein